MKVKLLATMGFVLFTYQGVVNATTIATMDLAHWSSLNDPGNSNVTTQEADGIKFTAAIYDGTSTTFRHGATLQYNGIDDFQDSTIKYKFMANGAGTFMDANVGLLVGVQGVAMYGAMSRYTTGNPFGSYQIAENQWYYSTLRITPDMHYVYTLSQNGYASDAGATVLNVLDRVLSTSDFNSLIATHLAINIGDNRNWVGTQWMKVSEVSYDTASSASVPEPPTIFLFSMGVVGFTVAKKHLNVFKSNIQTRKAELGTGSAG